MEPKEYERMWLTKRWAKIYFNWQYTHYLRRNNIKMDLKKTEWWDVH
jgi:hypothetical protein